MSCFAVWDFNFATLFPPVMSVIDTSVRAGLVLINRNNFQEVLRFSSRVKVGYLGTFTKDALCETGMPATNMAIPLPVFKASNLAESSDDGERLITLYQPYSLLDGKVSPFRVSQDPQGTEHRNHIHSLVKLIKERIYRVASLEVIVWVQLRRLDENVK